MIAPPGPSPPPSRRAGLRSLTNKVALLFAGVVLVAFGVVYFYIVPQLRSNLEQQVMDELAEAAADSSGAIEHVMDTDDPSPNVDRAVQRAADDTDARVTLLGVQSSPDDAGVFYAIADSNLDSPGVLDGIGRENEEGGSRGGSEGAAADPFGLQPRVPGGEDLRDGEEPGGTPLPAPDVSLAVADAAVDLGEVETGLGRSRSDLVAQAAAPLRESPGVPPEWVAVYSRPISDVNEAVGLIQRQVLVAGLLAVVVALAGGWLVARAVARRVRRLESAAEDFAEGKDVSPLPVDSEDELGQLTRAFNEMQEQLARVDRSRRDFIANASHELRTPIFSLGGFLELLQDEELDPATRERFLASMREQIDRLQRLAADLLDLSRLDAGALEMHPREADLMEVTEAVIHEFAPVTASHHTSLGVNLPEEGVVAFCDPDRVAQIVRILLDNAIRHNPPGTPVTVSATRRDGSVELSVSDLGRGLEPATADRVFDRFYTSDSSRGSGLGLAIARELAERMDGRIGVASRPGRTVFTLMLPASRDRSEHSEDGWVLEASVPGGAEGGPG
jgi:two-component system, OmpR family, sensor kinase